MGDTQQPDWERLRDGIVGLGERSFRKSYYPELRSRVRELERFRALLDAAREAILLLDASTGALIDCNESAATMLGVELAELQGRSLAEFLPAADWEKIHARATGAGEPDEEPLRTALRRGGAPTPVELTVARRTIDGEHLAVVVARDIGGRLAAEKKLRSREEELRQAQKMESIGRLAGGLAHDFNNLLAVIMGYCDMFELGLVDGPMPPEIGEIHQAAKRASDLTRQLLSLSRKQPSEPRLLNVSELVRGMAKMLRRVLPEDVELKTDLASDVATVMADPGQLEQVILNLVVNARDALRAGTGTIRIETYSSQSGGPCPLKSCSTGECGCSVVAVHDDGCGMDAETRARVFEPFFTTKESGKGTGLGLSTVYGIVRHSGGQVTVESSPGNGTVFRVFLPIAEGEEDSEDLRPTSSAKGGSETVLVAEDETMLRTLAERVLRSAGYSVTTARDGAHALEILERRERRFDLLLTDVIMPRTNGVELADVVAAQFPETKIMFMSGYSDEALVRAGELSRRRLLRKPFTAGELSAAVRSELDGA